MRSPFTAVLFCFELTKDTEVLLPLLISSFCSYSFAVWAMKRSILTEKVARRCFNIFREYSVDPLDRFLVKDVFTSSHSDQKLMNIKVPTVYMEETCRVAADLMAENDIAHLSIVSRDSQTELGVVTLNDLLKARRFHFQEESHRETMFPILKTKEVDRT